MRESVISAVLRLSLSVGACLCGLGQARGQEAFTDIGAGLTGVGNCSLAWGDYDGDGDLDLALVGGFYVSEVYRNDSGVFTDTGAGLVRVHMCSLAWGDYDGDGDLDLALAGYGDESSYFSKVYRNDSGIFTDSGAAVTGVADCSLAWGDYDNDGDLDLALAGSTGGSTYASKIYRNDGWTFTDIGAGLSESWNGSLAWGDYDNDGDLDLALTGGGVNKVYRNDDGTFTDIDAGFPWVNACSLAWGDYDNDGDLDLVLAGLFSGEGYVSKVYRNDPGAFTEVSVGLTGVYGCSLAWGDYDNDGDLDLALAGNTEPYTPPSPDSRDPVSKVYRNDSGVFADIGAGLTGVSGFLAWGDYDDDGDLDLALAGRMKGNPYLISNIYLHDGVAFNTPPSAPSGLSTVGSDGSATFSWNAAADTETPQVGLTYNLRVGTTPDGNEVMPGMATVGGSDDGKRLIPAMGNVQLNTAWTLKGLPAGTCYWSVQTIDTAFTGSAWAAEKSLLVPGYIMLTPNGGEVWYYGAADQLVTWTRVTMSSNIDIHYTTDGGSTWTVVALDVADTGSYSWAIPDQDSDQCLVRVQETGGAGPCEVSDAPFRIAQKTVTVALPTSATEGDGTLVGVGMVSIPAAWTADLVIDLTSSDTTEFTVSPAVTVLQGETSAMFDVTVEDDGEIDGTQSAAVTPTLAGWTGVAGPMDVLDNETQTITVTLPASAIEGDGTLEDQGMVSIPGTWTTDLVIDLESSDTTELTVPATVTIPQGGTSATFDLTIVDDGVHDDTQTVTVTASALGWTPDSAEMDVIYKAVTPFAGGCRVSRQTGAAGLAGLAFCLLIACVAIRRFPVR